MKKNFKRRDFLKKAGIGGAAAAVVSSIFFIMLNHISWLVPPSALP